MGDILYDVRKGGGIHKVLACARGMRCGSLISFCSHAEVCLPHLALVQIDENFNQGNDVGHISVDLVTGEVSRIFWQSLPMVVV